MIIVALISLALVASAYGEEYRDINTSEGTVRGKATYALGINEVVVFSYLGIPYAKPPLGELRFKKPQPVEPWEGTLNASDLPSACPQYSSYPYPWYDQDPDGKSEDCLYLNVFTPAKSRFLRPVVLFIHGGGFQVGSNRLRNYNGLMYAIDLNGDPEDLNYNYDAEEEKDNGRDQLQPMVVVTINYRLGALGFFTTGTDNAPGNVGMHDMFMALDWIKRNIKAFGGNPDLITLYGQGSGSIAVSLFCVSPLAKGLFQRAMLHSGSFLSHRENSFENNRKISQRLAETLGCIPEDGTFDEQTEEVVTCLQGIDADKIVDTVNSFDPEEMMMFYPEYDGELLPTDPQQALIDGEAHDVPIFIGASADEGSFLLTTKYPEVFGRFGEKNLGLNMTFAKSIFMDAFKSYSEPEQIAEYYLGDLNENNEIAIRKRTYNALGDDKIFCPTVNFAREYGDHFGKTNFFVFDYKGIGMPWAKWMGSVHYNDAPYLLSMLSIDQPPGSTQSQRDTSIGERAWAGQFALTGAMTRFDGVKFSSVQRYRFLDDKRHWNDYDPRTLGGSCGFLRKYHGF